jgi:hypothetical protein
MIPRSQRASTRHAHRRVAAVLAGVTFVIASSFATTQPSAATAPIIGGHALARPSGSVFLNAHDLRVVRRLHAQGLTPAAALASIRRHRSPAVKASTRSTAGMVPTQTGVCSFWTVQWAPDIDGSGRRIPTRCGDTTFGWTKIMTKHGVTNITLVQRLYQQQPTKIVGTQLEYDGYVVQSSDLSVVLPLRAVVETTGYSLRRGESSPDGMMLGTNTVYCMTGVSLCPVWINLL